MDPQLDNRGVKRVLFFTHGLNLGGVSTHMSVLGQGLIRRGIRVGIAARELAPGAGFGLEFFQSQGFEIFQTDFAAYGATPRNFIKTVRAVRSIRRLVREFQPDVIHVHAPTLCLVARLCGVPYVTTFHIQVDGRNKRRIARYASKVLPTALGRVGFAIGAEMEHDLRDGMGLPAKIVRRTTYTVDESKFAPATPDQRRAARAHYGLDDETFVVCMLAAVEPRKNHEVILDALKIIKDRGGPKVVALMAGSDWGDRRAELEAKIASDGTADVARLLKHEPARRLYDASDAYALTSFQEGFPLSTIEAMHCGIVPIRTPCEGAAEQIIDGKTGFIVPFRDPTVLADRLTRLANDPALRRSMGEAARAFAGERYAVARMIDQTVAAYAMAMGQPEPAGMFTGSAS